MKDDLARERKIRMAKEKMAAILEPLSPEMRERLVKRIIQNAWDRRSERKVALKDKGGIDDPTLVRLIYGVPPDASHK